MISLSLSLPIRSNDFRNPPFGGDNTIAYAIRSVSLRYEPLLFFERELIIVLESKTKLDLPF